MCLRSFISLLRFEVAPRAPDYYVVAPILLVVVWIALAGSLVRRAGIISFYYYTSMWYYVPQLIYTMPSILTIAAIAAKRRINNYEL